MNYSIYAIIIVLCCKLFCFVNFRNENWLIAFGKNLKKRREEQKFTQEQLAYKSDLTLSQIARIETGRVNPTLCTMITIAKTLKINPVELLNIPFK